MSPHSLTLLWTRSTLATRFALAGGVVMLVSAGLIGTFVAARIEEAVVRNSADAAALYMDSVIAPLGQELAEENDLSPGARQALAEVLGAPPLGDRVVSYKLRNREGRLVAASDSALVGRDFGMTDELRAALDGRVVATFEDLHDEEDQGEAALGIPLLEVYAPIREAWTGTVIGVAEFYERADALHADLARARRNSWLAVILVLGAIGGAMYLIVLQGSRTIVRQQGELGRQLDALRALSDHNDRLRRRVSQAASRATALNEATLRNVGADLHDGPAQYIGYAALRLDGLRRHAPDPEAQQDFDAVSGSIQDALREIRQISRGLALPDIEHRPPCAILRGVAEAHTARTGAPVAVACTLPDDLPLSPAARICLYRVTQEGLTNGWRHGGGVEQSVAARCDAATLHLVVRDAGPGPGATPGTAPDGGIGLAALRDRVESLGGSIVLRARPEGGAELCMELEWEERND